MTDSNTETVHFMSNDHCQDQMLETTLMLVIFEKNMVSKYSIDNFVINCINLLFMKIIGTLQCKLQEIFNFIFVFCQFPKSSLFYYEYYINCCYYIILIYLFFIKITKPSDRNVSPLNFLFYYLNRTTMAASYY